MKFFEIFKKAGVLPFIFLSLMCRAQEPNFSMFHYSTFFTNPGELGVTEDVRIALNYRNQVIEEGDNFTTSSLSAFYPVAINNHTLVIGANLLNDEVSDFVATKGGMLGIAYRISLSANSTLSLGMQGGYFQRRTDSDFITDDQFVDGALDLDAVSADAVLNRNRSYPTLSGGVFYQLYDQRGHKKAFAGGSIFNAVEPNVSLSGDSDDNLPLSLKFTAGYNVYQRLKLSITPTLRWVNQSGENFMNLGSLLGYALEENDEGVSKIELGFWYHTNDFGIFSIAYEQPDITIGVSYDLPISSDLSEAQNGVIELVIAMRIGRIKKEVDPSAHPQTNTDSAAH